MRILLLSPYHGGSHKAWAEGYARHSAHEVHLLTLPARFWKWRMEGGAINLARRALPRLADPTQSPDLILATDMLDLSRFMALTKPYTSHLPTALYMHENQLTYPLPQKPGTGPMRRQHGARDRHYVLTNLVSMLTADGVYFNSDYHRQSFFDELPRFLSHYPEYNELQMIGSLDAKSQVLPVGIDFARLDPPLPALDDRPPLILWNQRWEYDKNPERFVTILLQLAGEGLPFEVALCGERFGLKAPALDEGIQTLGKRIIHDGYANDDLYRRLLWQSSLTFSTALHEYFGISMLEGIHANTLPFLPRRLSYPEIIPAAFHEICLYEGQELLSRLRWGLANPQEARAVAARLAEATAGYAWPLMAAEYDRRFEALLAASRPRPR
jgi:glycosyltransferase involved in cell wall biosynthesis